MELKLSKLLITSGCSFSECISEHIDTWPRHLARTLEQHNHISGAMSSQGNGLISRSIVYHVSQALKETDTKDLLVGIVWSGPDRWDFYLEQPPAFSAHDGWMSNPTGFTKNKNWVILNHGWTNNFAKMHYSTFHDSIGASIYTLEHVLRVQWFLEKHKIPYFMGTYTGEVLPKYLSTHSETQHLYDQINFDNFLPVEGVYEWCRDYSRLPFIVPGDKHPSTQQHKIFTEQVIVPFLTRKKYI